MQQLEIKHAVFIYGVISMTVVETVTVGLV